MRVVKLWCFQAHFPCTPLFTQASVYRWHFAGCTGDIDSDAFFRQPGLLLQVVLDDSCALLEFWFTVWLLLSCAGRAGCFLDARSSLQGRVDRFVTACGPFTVSIICFCGFTFCSALMLPVCFCKVYLHGYADYSVFRAVAMVGAPSTA